MKLLGAVFLCAALVNLVQGKVVTKLDECNQFFMAGQAPTFKGESIPDVERKYQFHFICQTQKPDPTAEDYKYFTLYDTGMKIPVYSAYILHKRPKGQTITRKKTWTTEPQLGERINQAVNDDYKNSGYDKGHLYPVNHAHDQSAADATFTLTNAAPQNCMFNREWYLEVERVVPQKLENCEHDFKYVVTGVRYGNNKLNNRVNVPSHYWTAYCCKGKFSGTYMMSENLEVKYYSVIDFQTETQIKPFGDKCVF